MDDYTVFPDKPVLDAGPIAKAFISLGIATFWEACREVHDMPYGYNSDRDDLMILFKERMGSCTTKHAVIATLAAELDLAIEKHVGIYAMTEDIVTGTKKILSQHKLPYLPMLHCYLCYQNHRVDLTEGNKNGKNRPIDDLLFAVRVSPNISEKEEYLLYRMALRDDILKRPEFDGVDLKKLLKARENGLALLRSKIFQ